MDGIFISYRRDDAAGYAGRLYDRLVGHFGPEQVFMDVEGIELGLDFVEAIELAVGSCRVLIVIIGDEWTTVTDAAGNRRLDDPHDFIRLETGTALKRQIRVVPVLVGGAVMPRADELPDELKSLTRRQAIEINHKQWDASSGELIRALEGILTVGTPAPEPEASQPIPIAPPPAPASVPPPPPVPAATPEPVSAPEPSRSGPTAARTPAVASPAPAAGQARLWLLLAAAIAISAAVGWWVAGRPGDSEQMTPREMVQADAPPMPDPSPSPAEVKPIEPASAATIVPPPASTSTASTATPAVPAAVQSPAPASTAATVTAATPTPAPAPAAAAPPTIPPSAVRPTPAPPTQPAPTPAPPVGNAQASTTTTTTPPQPPGKPSQTPVIRTFTANTSPAQVRLCYRVSDADSLDLSPRPGPLASKQQDCVTVALDAPAIFTLTARNGDAITRKRLAVVPQATAAASSETTAGPDAAPTAVAPEARSPVSPATPAPGPNAGTSTTATPAATPAPPPAPTATADATLPVAGERWVYRSSGKWRTSPKRRIEVVVRSVAGTVVTDTLTVVEPEAASGTETRRSRGDKPDFIGWASIGPEFSPYFSAFVDLQQQGPMTDLPTPDLDPVWQRWQSRATVLGRESVQVPAGRFDTVKVEVWSNRKRTGSSTEARVEPVRVHYLIWYAPQVKRYVRMERRISSADNSENEKDEFELLSYQGR